jgi:hypothetical protein
LVNTLITTTWVIWCKICAAEGIVMHEYIMQFIIDRAQQYGWIMPLTIPQPIQHPLTLKRSRMKYGCANVSRGPSRRYDDYCTLHVCRQKCVRGRSPQGEEVGDTRLQRRGESSVVR